MNITQNRGAAIDRAIIRFGEESTLPKFMLNVNNTKIYIPRRQQDYAVVSANSDMGEMPVNFKAANNGTYTLSFSNEEVSFSYLHLIDNLTGVDVDLLENPSYTFNAQTTDYASRFKLVFATGNATDDSFVFFSNGNWLINNDGKAIVQVVDVDRSHLEERADRRLLQHEHQHRSWRLHVPPHQRQRHEGAEGGGEMILTIVLDNKAAPYFQYGAAIFGMKPNRGRLTFYETSLCPIPDLFQQRGYIRPHLNVLISMPGLASSACLLSMVLP